MRKALIAATLALSCAFVAPAGAARQVLVLDAHVESFLQSYDGVRATLRSRGYYVSATDIGGRLRELEAPVADLATRAMLDGVAADAGFIDYADWLEVAHSVLVAERYISDPPERGGLEAALAELKGDPFLSEQQKVQVIASLRRTEARTAVLRPLEPNVTVVRRYAARIRAVTGLD